ncbi:MAG TPA: iron uptake system protein EfeO [Jatrophihabitans sp.]|nr:iron uptake system protein EfeO [Jatrophihabitans sp.]
MKSFRALAVSSLAVTAAALSACSSSGGGSSDRTSGGSGRASDVATDRRVANVEVTAAHGCQPDHSSFPAGGITFKIKNKDATAVSEVELLSGARIVGEKENVPPGFSGEFAVTVPAGTYTLYCPGASPERRPITVTGSSSSSAGNDTVTALLKQATTGYAKYVDTQVASLATAGQRLATALRGTDLAAAQKAYMLARPFYEKIEPVAESFVIGKDSVDADIDAREGDVPAGQWRGFHRIEKALFQQKSLAGLATYGDKLVADIGRLQKLTAGLTYQPTELANGAQELLDEVAASKITGEEERYSHIDLLDFAFNVEGSNQAFAQLQPALNEIDATLAKTIADRFAALDTLLDKYRTNANPSGFQFYGQLSASDKRTLAAAVKAVQEPLSKVAGKVANA